MGSRGEDPIEGLVDEPPKLILMLEMDVTTDILQSKNRKCIHVSLFYEKNACCSLVDTR